MNTHRLSRKQNIDCPDRGDLVIISKAHPRSKEERQGMQKAADENKVLAAV